MILTGLARLGHDGSLRYTPAGEPMLEMSLAYSYGTKKDTGGNRPAQWIKATLWGKRAESLKEYLTKGTAVSVVLTDVHNQEWEKKDGTTGVQFVGRVSEIELAGGGDRSAARKPEEESKQYAQASGAKQQRQAVVDFDDDIPF